MENSLFSFEPFEFGGVRDVYSNPKGYEREEGVTKGRRSQDWEEFGNLCSDHYDFYQENFEAEKGGSILSRDLQLQSFPDFGMLDDLHFDIISPPIHQPCQETEFSESQKGKQFPFSLASLELLNNYRNGLKKLNGEKLNVQRNDATCCTVGSRELSTEEVMRVAGARYIQLSGRRDDDLSPFGCSLLGLSDQETKDVELAHLLLASAEKVGNQQFERATKLINQCLYSSSGTGNPVQRVVYYFARALRERIDRESGRITPKTSNGRKKLELDCEEKMMSPNPSLLACFQTLPYAQVMQFTGIQAIVENVESAKKIHIIDLGIRIGVQWTTLMQALAVPDSNPIELLKITAVGTMARQKIEETCKRLASFAETLNIPFSFKVVIVSDMNDLKEDLFEVKPDESIVVYSPLVLRIMLPRPDRLETLMGVIRKLKPVVMVVTEVEGNHNSPLFVNRFIEVLFYFSAVFDCLEACMDRNDPNRMITEGVYLDEGIRNVVATEGEERLNRHVKISVWRAFFTRFGMVETELSQSALYQASLIAKQFSCGSSCTLDMNGKCLIAGWKGTPIHSISVWKFQ